MDTANAAQRSNPVDDRPEILYPLMLIAAIAVIVMSAIGTATMLGWMPESLSASPPAARSAQAPARMTAEA